MGKGKYAAEKAERLRRFERLREEMREKGWTEKSCTISVLKANLMAFVTTAPLIAAFLIPFFALRSACFLLSAPRLLLMLLAFYLLIPVHELLHGLFWSFFCENGWRDIRFGVMWSSLTPYCHCTRPLSAGAYYAGLLAPFVFLGLGVSAAGILLGAPFVLLLGCFNLLAAGGDLTIALLLLRHRRGVIADHPFECGFFAFYPPHLTFNH